MEVLGKPGAPPAPPGGPNLARGEVTLPALAVFETALEHNVELMARYSREHGFDLAPHGKTTMVPAILRRQLRAGAWGITVADVAQAKVALAAGSPRVLIANEVVARRDIEWLGLALGPGRAELICLVDSLAGVELLEGGLAGLEAPRPLGVLVELGVPGGRCGARSVEDACRVAAAVGSAPHLKLLGVEGYEGGLGSDRSPETLGRVDAYLGSLRLLARELAGRAAFGGQEPFVVSAGGSKYFDRVAALLGPGADYGGHRARLVVRAGCYVTHDHGAYEAVSPLPAGGSGGRARLRPALEVWADVLSAPEPGRAIVGLGKRDVSFDLGLPRPLRLARAGGSGVEELRDVSVVALDDQHGYLRLGRGGPPGGLRPGDRVGFGISHPCTVFDKFGEVLLVDDSYGVIERLPTCFR